MILGTKLSFVLAARCPARPGQAEPTRGRNNHKAESIEFFKTFPDNHLINHPYKVEIAQGEWTCTVAGFTGTMQGPMKGPEVIAPTNKKFHIEFCTVAHWINGEVIQEKLFYAAYDPTIVPALTQRLVRRDKEGSFGRIAAARSLRGLAPLGIDSASKIAKSEVFMKALDVPKLNTNVWFTRKHTHWKQPCN